MAIRFTRFSVGLSWPTFFLEPLEEVLCHRHQAPVAEAASQVGAQQSEGLEVRRAIEVVAMLLQPVADHWRQYTASRTRRRHVDNRLVDELRANTAWELKHLPARADGIIQAGG